MLSLERILNESMWVVRFSYGYRMTGTYEELKPYMDDEDVKDIDLLAEQPEHLKDFFEKLWAHKGWITIPDFYNQYYVKGA